MDTDFVLEDLDELVRRSLSLDDAPNADPLQTKKPTDSNKNLLTTIKQERTRIEIELAKQVFKIQKAGVIRKLITKNHDYLVALLDSLYYQAIGENEMTPGYRAIYDTLIDEIGVLLEFFDRFFPSYISQEKKVPLKYLVDIKADLSAKLSAIRGDFVARIGDDSLTGLVLDEVDRFIADDRNADSVTFGAVKYFRELVDEMETLSEPEKEFCVFSALNEFLIRSDFNSRRYVNHFTAREEKQLESLGEKGDKVGYLSKRRKEFAEMHVRTDHRLDPRFPGLKDTILNWYNNELDFLDLKVHSIFAGGSEMTDEEIRQFAHSKSKVLLNLSGDQISILLRAASEEEMVTAPSVSALYRTVVPALSTPDKTDLSWNTMRGNRLTVEARDQNIVLNWLSRITKRVQSF